MSVVLFFLFIVYESHSKFFRVTFKRVTATLKSVKITLFRIKFTLNRVEIFKFFNNKTHIFQNIRISVISAYMRVISTRIVRL
jgi:hypothetical protein